jgi:hypothetical protein
MHQKPMKKTTTSLIIDSYPEKGLKLFPASLIAMVVGFVYIVVAVIIVVLVD